MARRIAIAVLAPPTWVPAGLDSHGWRAALAEDALDVLARLAEVEAAVAVPANDAGLVSTIGWPGLRSYEVPSLDVATIFSAVAADGFDQAVLLAADAPDLPGMIIAKLLRPLTTRPLAVAAALGVPGDGAGPRRGTGSSPPGGEGLDGQGLDGQGLDGQGLDGQGLDGQGLIGLAARLPVPAWLPALTLDEINPTGLRRLAPAAQDVAPATPWHRLRSPADLTRLDPRLEGWEATRALLDAPASRGPNLPTDRV